ncbi:hypothetical protein JCM17204_06950 [Blautia stercoris]
MGENCCMQESIKCYIPLTIERKLKAYSESSNHIERHEILWHEWNHNKRWLTQVQELILPSFPSYSRHDSSHSEAIIHNIEMLLGEENINELSATDCFAILHTVYIHDIGMCITHADREAILKNKRFCEYLKNLCESSNSDLSSYAQILLQECFKKKGTDVEQLHYILESKLKVYYAITYLLAEFRRKEHGTVSEARLLDWVDNPEKLGIGFSTIDIPNRIFYVIGSCASTHTKWGFDEVLKLKQEDSGFALDYIHPRFIAVLLQLGDALDMDNNRFHPLTEEFLGKMPKESYAHWKKHKAIRRLRITNEKVSISADCKNQEELRLVRMECDTIQDILKNATFYWSVIKPKNSKACLPTIDQTNLLLNGNSISPELVESQFEIAQEKAFELLIGNNIYTDQHFVFLRELLQNAVDATKIQYYREYKRRCRGERYVELEQKNEETKEAMQEVNPLVISSKVSPLNYPIVIELSIKKKLRDDNDEEVFENVTEEDSKTSKDNSPECEYGVLVKIRDCGTGISQEDIKQISNVGTSYEAKKEEIESMPKWLQPTGTFGIGLQSVFLAAKYLKAYTHSTESAPFDITFYPRQDGKRGYINVMPRKTDNNSDPFGSCFELFVPHNKKKLHKDNPETWNGKDPFEKGYEESRDVRHSRELLKQMALYIGEIVGEPLFPIRLYLKDCDNANECEKFFDDRFIKKMKNLNVYVGNEEKICKTNEDDSEKGNITWAYNLDKSKDTKGPDTDNNIYKLDSENAKLHIWNQKYNTYARIGIDRILAMRDAINAPDDGSMKEKKGIKIYYKGIITALAEFKEDADLIEYMDIKDTLSREYLKLSRKGFSQKGYAYLEKVYHEIVKTARKALAEFDNEKVDGESELDENTSIGRISRKIDKLVYESQENKKSVEELQKNKKLLEKLCLSSTALIYFAMIKEKSEVYSNERDKDKKGLWAKLLDKINEKYKEKIKIKSTLYNIPIMKKVENQQEFQENGTITIFELIQSDNKYMVLSEREGGKNTHRWKQKLLKVNTNNYDEIKENIRKLRNENSLLERRKLIRNLEKLMSEYKYKTKDSSDENKKECSYLDKHKEEVILKWIVDNIPTMAIFGWTDDESKDYRINILDVDICDSVYFDLEMKELVLERIQEKAEKVQRCSSLVWTGFSGLSLEESRDSIEFVKRGKLSKAGYGKMIFPLTSEELKQEIKEYELKKEYKGIDNLIEVAKILQNLEADKKDKSISELEKAVQNIGEILKDTLDNKCNIKKEIIFDGVNVEKIKEEEMDRLVDCVKAIKEEMDVIKGEMNQIKEENSLGEELYQKYCKKLEQKKQYENIRDYIHVHGKLQPTHETIDLLYERYMYELAQIIVYNFYQKKIKGQVKKAIEDKGEELIKIENIWNLILEEYKKNLGV